MKFKIAVTDACIFIDLYDLDLLSSFFNLEMEVHTSSAVLFELNPELLQILKAYRSVDKLVVHNLQEEDFVAIGLDIYPKSLSATDKSVLYVANKLNACVLSSDKVLRNCAKNKSIEYHGMLWILDKLIETSLLSKREASVKLKLLIATNFIFRNNKQLMAEIEKRLKLWI
jgi:rRNA-processing protein FCF1